jgi:hypothetical protein
MASIDDIPNVKDLLPWLPPQRPSSQYAAFLKEQAGFAASNAARRAAGHPTRERRIDEAGANRKSGGQEKQRQQRLKDLPQTLRKIRANHKHPPGKGWKPNKSTVRQWAEDMSGQDYMDFSGSSTCFDSLVWQVEDGERGPDAMGVCVAVFNNRGRPVEYSYLISRSDMLAFGAASEGSWFNQSDLYDNYL